MKKIILNHKSYLLYDEIIKYSKELNNIKVDEYKFILFPQLIYMSLFVDSKFDIGAQDFYSSNVGSFTGEINLESLKSLNVKYTMISQYERCKILGEDKNETREKLYKSLNAKFNTLLCVGEDKRSSRPFYAIRNKINFYLKNVDRSKLRNLSIVYEPSYSIRSADIKDIKYLKDIIKRIKNYVKSRYGICADIYYAGYISNDNFKSIINICDGVVFGRKSSNISFINNLIKN